jgi:hypothetical protein
MAASYSLLHTDGEIGVAGSGHESMTIDRILECAVALNWKDLTSFDEASSIQVEYHVGSGHSLEYLKCWSSTQRGYWHLVCEYWMKSGPIYRSGLTFNGSIYSADFVRMLDAIMQRQAAFPPSSSDFPDGLIQISRPSESFINAAQKEMTGALDSIGPLLVKM